MKKRRKKKSYPDESLLEKRFSTTWNNLYPNHPPKREYHFSPTRKFRLDFAWPDKKLGVEIHGMGPGHYSLKGMSQDFEKGWEATYLGWDILYFTTAHVQTATIEDTIKVVAKQLNLPITNGYVPYSQRS